MAHSFSPMPLAVDLFDWPAPATTANLVSLYRCLLYAGHISADAFSSLPLANGRYGLTPRAERRRYVMPLS